MNEYFANKEESPRYSADYFHAMNSFVTDDKEGIAGQNNRYDKALLDPKFNDDEDMRHAAIEGLRVEQRQFVEDLQSEDYAPYEALAADYAQTQEELERTMAGVEKDDETVAAIRSRGEHAIRLSPYAKDEIEALVARKIEAVREEARQRAVGELAARQAQLEELYEIAGQAWPLPVASHDYAIADKIFKKAVGAYEADDAETESSESESSEFIVQDEIPVDPQRLAGIKFKDRILSHHRKRTHQASLLLAAHLVENADKVLIPEEIGRDVYTDQSHFDDRDPDEVPRLLRARVNTLLNRKKNEMGYSKVSSYLDEEGYALLYGWRRFLDKDTGTNVRDKIRIYMVTNNPEIIAKVTEQGGELRDDVIVQNGAGELAHQPDPTETELMNQGDLEHREKPADEVLVNKESFTKVIDWLKETGMVTSNDQSTKQVNGLKLTLMRMKSGKKIPKEIMPHSNFLYHRLASMPPNEQMSVNDIVLTTLGLPDKSIGKDRSKFGSYRQQVTEMVAGYFEEPTSV